ncbi:MAG: tetratricopeptide repeat protein [Cytophagales bacterium]|nr:tetratricopeptide repeat protein [Cytophagales bacterium]
MDILYQIAFNHNDPMKMVTYSQKLIEVAGRLSSQTDLWKGYYSLGQGYTLSGNLEQAIESYFQAIKIAENLNYEDGLGQVYSNLGDVYSDNGNHLNAISYYQKAFGILSRSNDSIHIAATLANLGYELYRVEMLDSSLLYHKMASVMFDSINYETGVLYCLGNIGLVYAKMGEHAQAEQNMQDAVTGLREYEDYYAISDFEKEIADIYRQRKDYKQALQYARGSLEVSEEKGLKVQARDASYKLYEIYMDTGDYGPAIQNLNKYYAYRDSITNAENIQRMADLRTEFEVGQKQAEVDLLTAEGETQRVVRISLIAGLAFVVVFALIQYRNNIQKKKTNRILNDQKTKLEELNQTKDRFFSIISHDLRGPVNAFHGVSRMIKFFVQQKQMGQLEELAEDIDQSVDRLSSLLDNLLNWAVQQQGNFPYVPEKLDIHAIADDLVKTFSTMATSKNIALVAEVEEGTEAWADRNTTMTIIRNLVSNALKFTPHEGEVKIKADVDDESILIQVLDNGVGIPAEKLNDLFKLQAKKSTWGTDGEKGLGLGLQLVYDFVALNKGKINVESTPDQGTTFSVWLPVFEEVAVPENA